MGAFVVVNKEGWIVTVAHIINQLSLMAEEEKALKDYQFQVEQINSNQELASKAKKKALLKLAKPNPNQTQNWSPWWSFPDPNVQLTSVAIIDVVDLAVGKLEPFNPKWVTDYPVFKDPSKDFESGVNLCKIGYPFHAFTPLWKPDTASFELPVGAIPFPIFPMDGIFTRTAEMVAEDGTDFGVPLLLVETSTPGLKGQSGGPTVDNKGSIWAIQSKTAHYPLGFDPEVPGKHGQKEHQFLNVGLGIHPKTIFALFDSLNISYNVSDY